MNITSNRFYQGSSIVKKTFIFLLFLLITISSVYLVWYINNRDRIDNKPSDASAPVFNYSDSFEQTRQNVRVVQVSENLGLVYKGDMSNFSIDTTLAYEGNKSLKITSSSGLVASDYLVKKSGVVGEASIYIYDTNTTESEGTTVSISDEGIKNYMILQIQPGKSSYVVRSNTNSFDSGIKRSKGWHKFEFRVERSGAMAYIDGKTIPGLTTNTGINKIYNFSIGRSGNAGVSNFDSLLIGTIQADASKIDFTNNVIPNVKYFETSYTSLKDHYDYNSTVVDRNNGSAGNGIANQDQVLQSFGGKSVLKEFEPLKGESYYAGHLGAIYAPPYHSGHSSVQSDSEGFHTGLAFYDKTKSISFHEGKASHPETVGTWSPSGLNVVNKYNLKSIDPAYAANDKLEVTGNKMALADELGAGMNLKIKNLSSTAFNSNLLILTNIPTLEKSDTWTWNEQASVPSEFTAKMTADGVVILKSSSGAYMAISTSVPVVGWQISSSSNEVVNNFMKSTPSKLPNTNSFSSPTKGTLSLGFVFDLGDIGIGQVKELNYVVVIGDSEASVIQKAKNYKTIDIVKQSEDHWNGRIVDLFTNKLPSVDFADPRIEEIYYNSALQYLLNKWTSLDLIAQKTNSAKSLATFKWTTGTDLLYSMGDSVIWRKTLIRNIGQSIYTSASAGIGKDHSQGTFNDPYAFSPYSMTNSLYEYVAVTGDRSILTQKIGNLTVLQLLEKQLNGFEIYGINYSPEKNSQINDDLLLQASKKLVNYGDDVNLFELSHPPCTLGGKYTGFVASPNGERYLAHKQLADMYKVLGNNQKDLFYRNISDNNKLALNTLWDANSGWFATINQYPSRWHDTARGATINPSQTKTLFYFQPIYNLIGYDGLLSDDQKLSMLGKMNLFVSKYGFLSISKANWPPTTSSSNPCDHRSDWAGTGLYSGSVGKMLSDLYQLDMSFKMNGKSTNTKDFAFSMISTQNSGYNYIADVPILPQQFPADTTNPALEANRSWYVESSSIAQSYIDGVMGLSPNLDMTWIKPKFPKELTTKGSALMTGAISQGHRVSVKQAVNGSKYEIQFEVSYVTSSKPNNFRFGYDGDLPADIYISGLKEGITYKAVGDSNVVYPTSVTPNGLKISLDKGKQTIIIR